MDQHRWDGFRGALEMYYDPVKESLWICPAESSGGSGCPWIYVAVLLQRDGRAMGAAPGNEREGVAEMHDLYRMHGTRVV